MAVFVARMRLGGSARLSLGVASPREYGEAMYVVGGENGVWRSTDGVSWTEATGAAAFSRRNYYQAVSFGGSLWLVGAMMVGIGMMCGGRRMGRIGSWRRVLRRFRGGLGIRWFLMGGAFGWWGALMFPGLGMMFGGRVMGWVGSWRLFRRRSLRGMGIRWFLMVGVCGCWGAGMAGGGMMCGGRRMG